MNSIEASISASPDKASESYKDKIEAFFKSCISKIKTKIAEKFGFKGDKLTEATDQALVFEATETIKAADEDGTRTEAEVAEIDQAVSNVMIEGAMEEAGMETSAGENPILTLEKDIDPHDIVNSINNLDAEGVTLDDGSSVADLATQVLEREYDGLDDAMTETAEVNEAQPNVKLAEAISRIASRELVRSGETLYRPREEIICDHGHIEGQRIDIMNRSDDGVTEISFKLRSGVEFNPKRVVRDGIVMGNGEIKYKGLNNGVEQSVCPARTYERDGVKIFIAAPPSEDDARVAKGLVKIEAPSDMAPEDVEKIVQKVIEDDLGIPNGLGEVSEESEREYKFSRYAWQHKIEGELTPEQQEAAERMEREEVFPGYTTMVEKGKHKEYLEKYGQDMRAFHNLHSGTVSSVYRMLTVGGMCSTERYKRGVIKSGMSSVEDFNTGGGDSFFTRISNGKQREKLHGVNVVFKPELFDRTDWYTYDSDEYGTTGEETFGSRKTPEELFEHEAKEEWPDDNEQMFRTGISPKYIESIIVPEDQRDGFINELKKMGIEEFDGKPIEEIIISHKKQEIKMDDMEDIDIPW